MAEDGLLHALELDGRGGATARDWAAVEAWRGGEGALWVHLDCNAARAAEWLRTQAGVEPMIAEAMLAEETRPRAVPLAGGTLVILRGVNLNPGAEPDDMVSLRIWAEAGRVVSVRLRPLKAVQDVMRAFEAGHGPATAGDLLVALAHRLIDRMAPVIDNIDDQIDAMEEEILTEASRKLRVRLAALRRDAITLRRYIAPQRDVMTKLQLEAAAWLTPEHRARLREVADRVTRYVEDLDAGRERAAVTQEELNARMADQMNRTMYVLSLVAAIFLPLGLLTGLLGINVGGIPGSGQSDAFYVVCGVLVVIAIAQLWVFKRMKWF